MSDNGTKCYYHEDREAVGHCENCGRLMCVSCKMIHRVRHSGSRSRRGYVERFEYCPICKYSKEEKFNVAGFLFVTAFLVMFIAFPISMGVLESAPPLFSIMFFGIPIVMLLTVINSALITGPKKRADATRKKNLFANEMGLDANYTKRGARSEIAYTSDSRPKNIQFDKKSFHCAQCGTILDKSARFCPSCGDSTQDELEMMNRG